MECLRQFSNIILVFRLFVICLLFCSWFYFEFHLTTKPHKDIIAGSSKILSRPNPHQYKDVILPEQETPSSPADETTPITNKTILETPSSERRSPAPHPTKLDTETDGNTKPKLKKILLWNSFFANTDYGFGLGSEEPFRRHNCSVCECQLTNNREDFQTADAVLFFAFLVRSFEIPKRAFDKQIYVYFNFEPPVKNELALMGHGTTYNLTFTYLNSPDTDILVPLGRIVPRPSNKPYEMPSIEYIKNKKMVLWAVSNCQAHSLRNEYSAELAKYLTIDIYGRCGTMACPNDIYKTHGECNRFFGSMYKFVLAFENGVCKDYVTEKTYRALQDDNVPVVYGKADYKALLPPKSYIDVADFDSPKKLAEYLLYLDTNHDEYLEYFKWKKDYMSLSSANLKKTEGFCRLCEILHDDDYVYKHDFDIEEFWDPERLCIHGEVERQFIHLFP